MNHSPRHTAMLARGGVSYRGGLHSSSRRNPNPARCFYDYGDLRLSGTALRRLRWIIQDAGKKPKVTGELRADYRRLLQHDVVEEDAAGEFWPTDLGLGFASAHRGVAL